MEEDGEDSVCVEETKTHQVLLQVTLIFIPASPSGQPIHLNQAMGNRSWITSQVYLSQWFLRFPYTFLLDMFTS